MKDRGVLQCLSRTKKNGGKTLAGEEVSRHRGKQPLTTNLCFPTHDLHEER